MSTLHSEVSPCSPSSSRLGSSLCGCVGDTAAVAVCNGQPADLESSGRGLLSGRYPDEILYGKAGFLLTVTWLRSLDVDVRIANGTLKEVASSIVASGRRYSREHSSQAPLMWSWHGTEYLGAAHGVAGICHALLSQRELLNQEDLRDVIATTDWLIGLEESKCGHWESSTDHLGSRRDKALVHWCHGSPGVVPLAALMYTILKNESYMEAAERGGEFIWKYGVLKKGPGLCHGVAGNGYAFLTLAKATGKDIWLQRAKCFAHLMMDPSVRHSQRVPDSPGSLFEGWSGALYFILDLFHPEKAQFPFFPTLV